MLDKRKAELNVGSPVIFWDSHRRKCSAIVQAVHGEVREYDGKLSVPCINVLFTSQDPKCTDQYGRQADHATSVGWGGDQRQRVGVYFTFMDEDLPPQEEHVATQK